MPTTNYAAESVAHYFLPYQDDEPSPDTTLQVYYGEEDDYHTSAARFDSSAYNVPLVGSAILKFTVDSTAGYLSSWNNSLRVYGVKLNTSLPGNMSGFEADIIGLPYVTVSNLDVDTAGSGGVVSVDVTSLLQAVGDGNLITFYFRPVWASDSRLQFSNVNLDVTDDSETLVLNLQVDANDWYVRSPSTFNNTSQTIIGKEVGDLYYRNGFRFTSATIPKNAIINSAFLTLRTLGASSDTITLRAYCQAVGDSENATNYATGDAISANKTTAYTETSRTYTTSGENINYDFKAALQEVVNGTGWASGNDFTILLETVAATGDDVASYFDGSDATHYPYVTINYSPPNSLFFDLDKTLSNTTLVSAFLKEEYYDLTKTLSPVTLVSSIKQTTFFSFQEDLADISLVACICDTNDYNLLKILGNITLDGEFLGEQGFSLDLTLGDIVSDAFYNDIPPIQTFLTKTLDSVILTATFDFDILLTFLQTLPPIQVYSSWDLEDPYLLTKTLADITMIGRFTPGTDSEVEDGLFFKDLFLGNDDASIYSGS